MNLFKKKNMGLSKKVECGRLVRFTSTCRRVACVQKAFLDNPIFKR